MLAVVKDEIEEEYDDALATFVINSHMKNHPEIMSAFKKADNEGFTPEEKQQEIDRINQTVSSTALPNNRMAQNEKNLIQ